MAAERAADEAAEAVESAHQRVLADVAAVAVSVGGQTVGGRRVREGCFRERTHQRCILTWCGCKERLRRWRWGRVENKKTPVH